MKQWPGLVRRLGAATVLIATGACAHNSRTPLVVYSPHGKDLLQYYAQEFEAAHPTVDVQWVDMGSQDVLDRLRSERANPQADVWFGAPSETFTRAAGEGLLEAYRPTWAADVPDDTHDSRDLWYGTYLTPEVIAYNSDAVSKVDAPQDWDDVLDPKWKGQVLIRDPIASGSMRAIFSAIVARSIAQTGSEAAGWEWLRRLDGQTSEYTLNPTLLYQKLGRREGLISLWDMPDIAELERKSEFPIAYAIPTSGTPLLVDAIAIVKGSKHPELAKQFYEFVTTPEALIDAARRFVRIPVRSDIAVDSLPDWYRAVQLRLKPMQIDRQMLLDSTDTWMRYWDANIRNSRRGK